MKKVIFIVLASVCAFCTPSNSKPLFKAIAFFTGREDLAHVSFVHEANKWFPKMAVKYNFQYDSTSDWKNLNTEFLSNYQLVIFLDTRTENPEQRAAFQKYMEKGGAWIGFHFSAFALTPSAFNQDWPWFHNTFLGAGEYASNTWHPTSAILRVEDNKTPFTKGLPKTFKAAPNEWYRWSNDLRKNPDIKVLCSVDSTSFPLGTGPKKHEIWTSGDYPVVWTNTKFRMVYFNMGHNDMDYDGGTNKTLSSTFSSEDQNRLIMNSVLYLGRGK